MDRNSLDLFHIPHEFSKISLKMKMKRGIKDLPLLKYVGSIKTDYEPTVVES